MAGFVLFFVAIPVGLAPRRYWQALDVYVPVTRTSLASALATFALANVIGIPAFFRYIDASIGTLTAFAPFVFLIGTRVGNLSLYLALSGWMRFAAWYVDDAWGDPILTVADAIARGSWYRHKEKATKRDLERREGTAVPDLLMTGADLGMPDADLVVIASRRKPDWDAGAIVVTDEKWFKLGAAVEQQMPGGWRTLYPLTELHHHEVLRRAVPYKLPPLRRSKAISAP